MSTPSEPSIHLTVAAVIERDGRYLMVEEEIDGERVYNQPAGHLEPGESLLDAVRREVLEETTCTFTPTGLVGVYRWPLPGSDQTYVRFCFVGQAGDPDPARALDPDIRRALWLTPAEIRDLSPQLRSPLVLECLHDAQAGRSAPLTLLRDIAPTP